MSKVLIYAEGQTEERFIKDLLAPHLAGVGVHAQPVVATTKVVKTGPNFKGGIGKYSRTKKELLRLLNDSSASAVTTMLDYYGLDRSFPGRQSPQGADCYTRVAYVEEALSADISAPTFMPFLTLHEFEGLLFASPDDMAQALPGGEHLGSELSRIRRSFGTPEEINDDAETAPHRRIVNVYPNYKKPLHGSLITARIGLKEIRTQCPHFNKWVSKLERLAPQGSEGYQ